MTRQPWKRRRAQSRRRKQYRGTEAFDKFKSHLAKKDCRGAVRELFDLAWNKNEETDQNQLGAALEVLAAVCPKLSGPKKK